MERIKTENLRTEIKELKSKGFSLEEIREKLKLNSRQAVFYLLKTENPSERKRREIDQALKAQRESIVGELEKLKITVADKGKDWKRLATSNAEVLSIIKADTDIEVFNQSIDQAIKIVEGSKKFDRGIII